MLVVVADALGTVEDEMALLAAVGAEVFLDDGLAALGFGLAVLRRLIVCVCHVLWLWCGGKASAATFIYVWGASQ